MVTLLLAAVAAASQGQAAVRIHSPAIVRPADWRPATNPRQQERHTTERGRPVVLRITDYE